MNNVSYYNDDDDLWHVKKDVNIVSKDLNLLKDSQGWQNSDISVHIIKNPLALYVHTCVNLVTPPPIIWNDIFCSITARATYTLLPPCQQFMQIYISFILKF